MREPTRRYIPGKRGSYARTTVDRDLPSSGPEKRDRIDLGLALLSCFGLPGVCYSLDEIAAWCGCSNGAILLIEQRALKKLRNRLRFQKDPLLRELVASVVGRES